MPNIRIMTWNIEKLSDNKTSIAGMANNIARVIVDANADIVIIQELTSGTGPVALIRVSAAANALVGANNYKGLLASYATGRECYGVLIKDLNRVRPIVLVPPAGGEPDGTAVKPLNNLDQNQFKTWPAPFLGASAVADAYPLAVAPRPRLPLTNLYASPALVRAGTKRQFAGANLANGGYSLGVGFRLPCLAMFEILNGAGVATYLVPVLVSHLAAANRYVTNTLARGQIRQYKDCHIAQKFQNTPALCLPFGGYINLNNAIKPIQELIITGDFNVDFLEQSPPLDANIMRSANRTAWNSITPTTTNGGTAAPLAAPGAPILYNPVPPPPLLPPPGVVPFFIPDPPPAGPPYPNIPNLALKTANTHQGTILNRYNAMVVPAHLAALRGAAFDNFFFGGTQLSATYQNLTLMPAPADAAEVIDLPAQIVNGGTPGGAGALNVSGAWTYHMIFPVTRNAAAAPSLGPGAAPAVLTTNDSLIGARFISDHLPVIVQFNLP